MNKQYWIMPLKDWIMVIALLVGPILAVLITYLRERKTKRREDRESIFRELIKIRDHRIWMHNQIYAFNLIDSVFGYKNKSLHKVCKKDKEVISEWRKMKKLLGAKISDNPSKKEISIIVKKRQEQYYKLLSVLSKAVGYNYDPKFIEKTMFVPIWMIEEKEVLIRKHKYELAYYEHELLKIKSQN